MTLEKKKIENLNELPWRNFMLYQHGKPGEANLLKQKYGEEEIEFVLFPLPYPMPVDDFLALPESAPLELHFNQPVFKASLTDKHQKTSLNLLFSVYACLEENDSKGIVLPGPLDVHLPEGNVLQPDIIFVQDEKKLKQDGIHTAPDWVAEVLSPITRDKDEGIKLELLSENGTVEYWIIHPEECWVEQYIFDEETKKLLLHKKYEDENEVIESVAISGFSIALKKIFKGIEKK